MSQTLREVDGRELSSPAQFQQGSGRALSARGHARIGERLAGGSCGHALGGGFPLYLAGFDNGSQAEAFVGDPKIAGKYYYAEDLKGFNFERRRMRFGDALAAIVATHGQSGAPTMYVGSLPVNDYLPGFAAQNVLPVLAAHVAARIWLGHASNVSAHFDAYDNVACVVAGTRRFTLYPPEAIEGLYVGPLDNTMAGQPVSLAASAPRRTRRSIRCSARSATRR